MTLALRSRTVVNEDHAVFLRAPELKPGVVVEVIVLVEQAEAGSQAGASFLDAMKDIQIDAPADYSTNFDNTIYANRIGT